MHWMHSGVGLKGPQGGVSAQAAEQKEQAQSPMVS